MDDDKHLDMGQYDPEKYWDARARSGKGQGFSAICVNNAIAEENESAHKVQRSAIKRILNDLMISGKNVLEYGCGIGRWVSLFERYGVEWHGVDISKEMIETARQEHPKAELKLVDEKIPYPDNSMDLVYSVTVIHHNRYPDQEKILGEIHRVLREDGHFIMLEDLGEGEGYNMFPRTRDSWIDIARGNGFELRHHIGLKYWIIRDLLQHFFGKMGTGIKSVYNDEGMVRGQMSIKMIMRKIIGKVDATLDPALYRVIPRKYHTTAVFLFQKTTYK
ncbi:MAG: class I SAM-dependent methyltransferase [Nitrospirota bacterium]|nr:MAG: class I SAM-dependent methyltransferase [Nitrospirota bacterium]